MGRRTSSDPLDASARETFEERKSGYGYPRPLEGIKDTWGTLGIVVSITEQDSVRN